MIRVLIADDSVVFRAALVKVLSTDPELSVAAEASDGERAVKLASEVRPDVILMDADISKLDGFEATKRIMQESPTPIVIVVGSGTGPPSTGRKSFEASRGGAVMLLERLTALLDPADPQYEDACRRLIRIVKAMSQVKVARRYPERESSPWSARPPSTKHPLANSRPRYKVVAIAASAGGPAALLHILSELPSGLSAPVLVVQHMFTGFTEGLARWLDRGSRLRVKVAEEGEPLMSGTVYLAPSDQHLAVNRPLSIFLSQEDPIDGFRPSATHLFNSVAAVFGEGVVAVVLTGMGYDGVGGLGSVRNAGGLVIAQDEATCAVFGMPRAAIAAGVVDVVLPLHAISARIARSV